MKKIQVLGAFFVSFLTFTAFAQEAVEAAVQSCPKCHECSSCFGPAFGFAVLGLILGAAGGFFAAMKLFAKKSKSNDNFIEISVKNRELDELKSQLKSKENEATAAKAEFDKMSARIAEVLKKADEKRYAEITGAQFVGPMYEQVEMLISKLKEDYRFLGVRTFLEGKLSGRIEQFNSAIRTKDGTEALRVAELFVKDYDDAKEFYKEEK